MADVEKECRLLDLKMDSLQSHNFQIGEARTNLKPNQEVDIINPLAPTFLLCCSLFLKHLDLSSLPYSTSPEKVTSTRKKNY